MQIINYFESEKQQELRAQISGCDWGAAKFLAELLERNTFDDMLGGWGKLYLLMDGQSPAAFATLTGQDAVRDEGLVPWIGFVFTVPEYRGHRYSQQLLSHAEAAAWAMGHQKVFICTTHVGLYERFGYTYLENRTDYWGDDVRVLYKELNR